MSRTSKVLLGVLLLMVAGIVAGRIVLTRTAAARGTPASAAAGHAGHGKAGAVDWTRVSSRDLDIAELFIIARGSGVAPALEKLEALAANDTAIRDMGHVIAHALGRFVVGERHGDPSVYAGCREVFQAGCHHGVMEAYFASARAARADAVTPSALDSLCLRITRAAAARLVALECAHGMGHGLVVRFHGDVREALRACDHLMQRDARTECHDGVFMENAVRATTSADMRVGDAAVEAGAGSHQHPPLVRRGDVHYPCDDVEPSYQAACWRYQAVIMLEASRGDEARLLDGCARAPEAFRAECYFGIGKQSTGWWDDGRRVSRLCERVPATHRVACVGGAVESYLDEMWTVDRAVEFCAVVPESAKDGCYEVIGARLAIMRTNYPDIERECARAEPRFIPACVKGVAMVWLRR